MSAIRVNAVPAPQIAQIPVTQISVTQTQNVPRWALVTFGIMMLVNFILLVVLFVIVRSPSQDKPQSLADVAYTGSITDLSPPLHQVCVTGNYEDMSNLPILSHVALTLFECCNHGALYKKEMNSWIGPIFTYIAMLMRQQILCETETTLGGLRYIF